MMSRRMHNDQRALEPLGLTIHEDWALENQRSSRFARALNEAIRLQNERDQIENEKGSDSEARPKKRQKKRTG